MDTNTLIEDMWLKLRRLQAIVIVTICLSTVALTCVWYYSIRSNADTLGGMPRSGLINDGLLRGTNYRIVSLSGSAILVHLTADSDVKATTGPTELKVCYRVDKERWYVSWWADMSDRNNAELCRIFDPAVKTAKKLALDDQQLRDKFSETNPPETDGEHSNE